MDMFEKLFLIILAIGGLMFATNLICELLHYLA